VRLAARVSDLGRYLLSMILPMREELA